MKRKLKFQRNNDKLFITVIIIVKVSWFRMVNFVDDLYITQHCSHFLFLIGRKSGYFPYSIHFIAETQNRNNEGHDLLEISLLKQTGSHTHVAFKSHFSFIHRLSSNSNFTLWLQSGIEPENSRQYFKNGRKPWTYFHHVETRCSPKGTCWWNHQAFRTKRI